MHFEQSWQQNAENEILLLLFLIHVTAITTSSLSLAWKILEFCWEVEFLQALRFFENIKKEN